MEHTQFEITCLINLIIAWWEEHQYDTYTITAFDESSGEFNTYDKEPIFVKIAIEMKKQESLKGE